MRMVKLLDALARACAVLAGLLLGDQAALPAGLAERSVELATRETEPLAT